MPKGQISKEDAIQKILNLFPGSFIYEKEVRIPYQEQGEDIQLKCVLTCAKTNVEKNSEIAIPGGNIENIDEVGKKTNFVIQPSQEEKDNVRKLMESLGL